MGIEDRVDIAERMPGDGGDLLHGRASERQALHGRSPQIIEGLADDAGPQLRPAQAERKLSAVHDLPSVLTMMIWLWRTVASSSALRGAPTRMLTRRPVFDRSYDAHVVTPRSLRQTEEG